MHGNGKAWKPHGLLVENAEPACISNRSAAFSLGMKMDRKNPVPNTVFINSFSICSETVWLIFLVFSYFSFSIHDNDNTVFLPLFTSYRL